MISGGVLHVQLFRFLEKVPDQIIDQRSEDQCCVFGVSFSLLNVHILQNLVDGFSLFGICNNLADDASEFLRVLVLEF